MNADVALMMALPNESKGLFEQAGIEVGMSSKIWRNFLNILAGK